ncbi:RNA-directed DNA polymerase, eukaryota, partial [Tanacetum coccineum]
RKVHLLEDKQIPSVGTFNELLEDMHVTWTHLGKKQDKISALQRSDFKNCSQSLETASQFPSDAVRSYKRWHVPKDQDLTQVRMQLIDDIMKIRELKISNVGQGIMVIKKIMSSKPILLVLDALDDQDQLKALAGSTSWFFPGSLIIFTEPNYVHLGWVAGENAPLGCPWTDPMFMDFLQDIRSKVDDVLNISTSFFVTNFPEQTTTKELWRLCKQYGNVIDVFIPNRRSKLGKRFGFVRFIKILDVERLVNNLCTIWIGKFKLHVNIARFNRPMLNKGSHSFNSNANVKPVSDASFKKVGSGPSSSYIQAAKVGIPSLSDAKALKPALVLDDSCAHETDHTLSLVGKLKEFGSLPNLNKILVEEGFPDIIIRYMGGLWVILQFSSKTSKDNFMLHVGVNSWFSKIQQASNSFNVDEKVVWIDIEGVPLCAWSNNTFTRIASIWGLLLYDEDENSPHFHKKHLCIKTSNQDIIFDSIKIIVKGKVFLIRVKELTGWAPSFNDSNEDASDSDEELVDSQNVSILKDEFSDKNNDMEEIPETVFDTPEHAGNILHVSNEVHKEIREEEKSEDPFNIYDMFNKEKPAKSVEHSDGDLQYPPRFTPCDSFKEDVNVSGCSGHFQSVNVPKTGGSILQVIEDFIKVGQTMGYKMEGCLAQKAKKDWVKELCYNNKVNFLTLQETKMEQVDLFNIKACWGNINFYYVVSPSVGNSGGILCVWDSNMFYKDNSTVLDYFIAIMGNWLPNIRGVLVMGDFNEVRLEEEKYGSIFNTLGAAAFNSFIVDSGLVKVPSGGFSFTWSHNNIKIIEPNAMFKMAKKLKILKGHIRVWVKGKKDSATDLKKELKNKLSNIDSSTDKGKVSSAILEDRLDTMNKLSSLENMESIVLAPKAKLMGDWIEDPAAVKKDFLSHFQNKFEAPCASRLLMDMKFPNRLSLDQALDLERHFSKEEIKGAVWDCGLDKSPGPDGFTFGFYRRYWSLIEDDVVEAVNHFYNNGFCHKGGNSSFIALIPKTQGAKLVKDFRPISLIGSLYKIITKLLANRLVIVIGDLVNDVQSAFIANRQILDGPFILNELIHWCKAKKKKTMIFKVDFEKAFDSVRWDFLEDVLKKFGFGSRLKQSDPLSPFLFILVMESLHLSFQNVVNAGLFKGVVLDNSLQLSHLFYADDVIFIGQWCTSNITTIIRVLECFFRASGLRINLHKSKLMGVAVENSLVNSAANNIGCMTLSLPFSYLGVNVGGHMSRIASWDVVINKVLSRLSKWKMKVLSVGGRLTLLKSVLGSTPIYYMSLFKAPVQVINKLEAIRSHFFNGVEHSVRKMMLVKWDNVLASKEKGGLGVSSFYALNRALIFKWVWRFRTQGNSIWSRVIKALHGEEGNLGCPTNAKFPSNWSDIIRTLPTLYNKGVDLLGFLFQEVIFPRLYALETVKNISVADKMAQPSLDSSFKRNVRGGVEQVQMALLLSLLEGLILPNMIDRWTWLISRDGEFSVSSVKNFIDDKILGTVGSKTQWCKYVLIKVNILSWRVKLNNLPSRLNLSCRGLELHSILCPSCNLAVESTDHLFFSCSMMKGLYTSIAKWWDVSMPEFSSFEEWWEWFSNLRLSSKLKMLLEGVFYVTWWLAWNFHNKSIFGPNIPTKALLFDDIVAFSFTWCRSRSKLNFSRLDWLKNPMLISL